MSSNSSTPEPGTNIVPADPTSTAWSAPLGRQDTSRRLCGEKWSFWIGLGATVLIALPLVRVGSRQIMSAIDHMSWLLIAGWILAAAVQYHAANSWRGGLTDREILRAILPPLDVIRSIRLGINLSNKDREPVVSPENRGTIRLSEKKALMVGWVVAAVAVVAFCFSVYHVIAFVNALIWLLVIVWIMGALLYFWTADVWRGGLTVRKVINTLLWPGDMLIAVRAGVIKATSQK